MDGELFTARPLLLDRLQVTMFPEWAMIYKDFEYDVYKQTELSTTLAVVFQVLLNRSLQRSTDGSLTKIVSFKNKKGQHQRMISFGSEYMPLMDHDVYTKVYMNPNPYGVFPLTVDFNFIRYLLTLVSDFPSFDEVYHNSIKVHDTNYITNQCWPLFNISKVNEIYNQIPKMFIDDFSKLYADAFNGSSWYPNKCFVNHAEFNVDVYVGTNRSLPLISKLIDFMFTDRGREYMDEMKVHTSKVCKGINEAKGSSNDITLMDHAGSVQFQLGSGLFLKYYRKTKDHIRCEIVMEKPYIRKITSNYRGNPTNEITRSLSKAMRKAKILMKKANPEALIEFIDRDSKTVGKYEKFKQFIESIDPLYVDLFNHWDAGIPVKDRSLQHQIRSSSKLKEVFTRDSYKVNGDLHSGYFYDPFQRLKKKKRSSFGSDAFKSFKNKRTYKEWQESIWR